MYFSRFTRRTGYNLLILAVLCIVANTLLYFPNGETRFASEHHLNGYAECLPGILGAGLLMLIPAAVFIGLHGDDCCGRFGRESCGKSCAVLSTVLAAFVGIAGSGYCITISGLGLGQELYCSTPPERNLIYPSTDSTGEYLLEYNKSSECQEPQNIMRWNVTFFCMLLFLGGMEFVLCLIQLTDGIVGGLCGLRCRREEEYVC